MRARMLGGLAVLAGQLIAATPTHAADAATGTFTASASGTCSGSGSNYRCDFFINSTNTCFESYGGTAIGIGGCTVTVADDALITRGTATTGNTACTANNTNLRPTDVRNAIIVRSPSLGEVEVTPTVTYHGTSSVGKGTVTGFRQAITYNVTINATLTMTFGCGSQASGLISGNYTISK